jgi:hypothetical protein
MPVQSALAAVAIPPTLQTPNPHTPTPHPQGDTTKLIDDIGTLRPTIFIGVPRIFDRIYGGVTGQIKKASEWLCVGVMGGWGWGAGCSGRVCVVKARVFG